MKLLNKIEAACLIGIVLTLLCGNLEKTASVRDKITDNVLRLHILANSDSDEDQSLKLKVRDELLRRCPELFSGEGIAQAADIARKKLDELTEAARRIIKENGFDYPVTAGVTDMRFDKRNYDGFTMPAGKYTALRVEIGEAAGRNWWCVMYPPLCLPAAEEKAEDYFDSEQCDILENPEKYEVRFKILELVESLGELSPNEEYNAPAEQTTPKNPLYSKPKDINKQSYVHNLRLKCPAI